MKSLKIHTAVVLLVLAAAFVSGCSQKPQEVRYGEDQCAHCKMVITDPRFASEIVTSKGKAIKFDAIECMASYIKNNQDELADAKLWVSDFAKEGSWVDARKAYYVQSQEIQSPMGKSLLAFKTTDELNNHLKKYPGKELSWQQVQDL